MVTPAGAPPGVEPPGVEPLGSEPLGVAPIGFIGLGAMGAPMAANLATGGAELIVYDIAGPQRSPPAAVVAASVAAVAAAARTIFLSLPDGDVVAAVVGEIVAAPARKARTVIDTSTIGIAAAQAVHQALADAHMEFADAPVSGGVAGAEAATLSLMFSGRAQTFDRLLLWFKTMSSNQFHVGTTPGQGQAMKIANNFLSATAMAATSEAVAFGTSQGLEMKTMLDVINVSSGQNTATRDKFPQRVLTQTYDAGFRNDQMEKDCRLYLQSVQAAGTADRLGEVVKAMWTHHNEAEPAADISRIYPFIRERR
ncbi:MAG: NAD-binding protein [Gammaproteobacteria bacterium]|nr:NAD-binding protein [Gammaproteobacteria bacterium]